MAGTITTTTTSQAFRWPGQSYMDVKVKYNPGSMFTLTLSGTTLNVFYLQNAVGAWSALSGMALARTGITDLGAFFIDVYGYGHCTYTVNESGKDRIMYRRINLQSSPAAWGSELLVTEASNGGSAGSVLYGSDLVAVKVGTETRVAIVVSFQSGSNTGMRMYAFKVATGNAFPSSTYDITTSAFSGTRSWTWAGTGKWQPSIDVTHTGDAHTVSTPHLWITGGRTRANWGRLAYTSGKWQGPTGLYNFDLNVNTVEYALGRWDGKRFLSATVLTASPDAVTVHERDAGNTKTTIRTTPPHPTGNIRSRAINYDSYTQDIRVWAVGTSTTVLYFVDYIRSSGTWGSWAQFDPTAVQDSRSYGVRRGSANHAYHDVYWQQAGVSPYTLTHTQQALSYAPNAPAWYYPSPANGAAADINERLLFNWVFSDPDPQDTQSAVALSRQIGAGTLSYWRISDGTWQATEQKNTTGVTAISVPAGWGADADLPHTYRLKVWDSTDTPSAYSTGVTIVPSVTSDPTLTQPVDGAVWTSESLTATWTVGTQTQRAVRLYQAFDDFNRTASNGYGTGPRGQTYTLANPTTDYSSAAGVATMAISAVNTLRRARTDTAWSTPEGYVEFQVPVTPTGSYIVAELLYGWTSASDYWRAAAVVNTNGSVDLVIGKRVAGTYTNFASVTVFAAGTHSTSRWYGLRTSYDGVNVKAKLWDAANAEPAAWDLIDGVSPEVPPTGNIALQTWSNTGNTNTMPVNVKFRQWTRGDTDKVYDSGFVGTTDPLVVVPYSLPDLTSWRLELQTANAEALPSNIASAAFTVDYLEPPIPTVTVQPVPSVGAMRLFITNPSPVGGQPAFQSQEVYRRPIVYTNVAPNPTFEVDTSGWVPTGATFVRSTSQFHSGAAAGFLTPNGATFNPRIDTATPSQPSVTVDGQLWTVEGWVRPTTANKPITLGINWFDGTNTYLSTSIGADIPVVAAGQWQFVSVTYAAPPTAAKVSMTLGLSNTPAATDTMYVDDIRMRPTDANEGDHLASALPAGATWDDNKAVSGVDYEYKVRAFGANGTRIDSPWT